MPKHPEWPDHPSTLPRQIELLCPWKHPVAQGQSLSSEPRQERSGVITKQHPSAESRAVRVRPCLSVFVPAAKGSEGPEPWDQQRRDQPKQEIERCADPQKVGEP